MRLPGAIRVALVVTAALSLSTTQSEAYTAAIARQSNVAAVDATPQLPSYVTRALVASSHAAEADEATEAPKKKRKKKQEPATEGSAAAAEKKKKAEEAAAEEKTLEELEALEEEIEEAEALEAKETEKKEAAEPTKKKKKAHAEEGEMEKPAKKTKKKKAEAEEEEEEKEEKKDEERSVKDKKIKGKTNNGLIDHSSEGSAEIDKIDPNNDDGWVSVYDDPPLLVIKASLYAFIAYNDTAVCDTFNMTMNAVEQKEEENGRFAFHVVAYINCTKNGEDETQGRFILNFIPEGKRLLLTECGHREEGEIVNWLRIQDEVPECMTPKQRKDFLAQPMKHIHASNGSSDGEAVQTDFLTRLEELDGEEVAIFGSATVALIAVIVVLVVFCMRKRKAQMDLERTIAGAKAEHAVEDDDLQTEVEEKVTKERKGLMDSAKGKGDDPDMEEGSFVNSPAVRV